MSRPKKPDARVHITATISKINRVAILKYIADDKNRDADGNRATLSGIVDSALTPVLKAYQPTDAEVAAYNARNDRTPGAPA